MEQETNVPDYEVPQIEDHGDLTELTAAIGVHGHFDGSFKEGQTIPPVYGTSP